MAVERDQPRSRTTSLAGLVEGLASVPPERGGLSTTAAGRQDEPRTGQEAALEKRTPGQPRGDQRPSGPIGGYVPGPARKPGSAISRIYSPRGGDSLVVNKAVHIPSDPRSTILSQTSRLHTRA